MMDDIRILYEYHDWYEKHEIILLYSIAVSRKT